MKYRMVTLPTGKKIRMTEDEIAGWAGFEKYGMGLGEGRATASIGFGLRMQGAAKRAKELGIEPKRSEWKFVGINKRNEEIINET